MTYYKIWVRVCRIIAVGDEKMAPENEFQENRDFTIPAQPERINEEAYQKFIQQYGADVEKGYKMGFSDLLPKVEEVILQTSHAKMRNKALEVFKYMKAILHLDSDLVKQSDSDAKINPFKPM